MTKGQAANIAAYQAGSWADNRGQVKKHLFKASMDQGQASIMGKTHRSGQKEIDYKL